MHKTTVVEEVAERIDPDDKSLRTKCRTLIQNELQCLNSEMTNLVAAPEEMTVGTEAHATNPQDGQVDVMGKIKARSHQLHQPRTDIPAPSQQQTPVARVGTGIALPALRDVREIETRVLSRESPGEGQTTTGKFHLTKIRTMVASTLCHLDRRHLLGHALGDAGPLEARRTLPLVPLTEATIDPASRAGRLPQADNRQLALHLGGGVVAVMNRTAHTTAALQLDLQPIDNVMAKRTQTKPVRSECIPTDLLVSMLEALHHHRHRLLQAGHQGHIEMDLAWIVVFQQGQPRRKRGTAADVDS